MTTYGRALTGLTIHVRDGKRSLCRIVEELMAPVLTEVPEGERLCRLCAKAANERGMML